MCFRAITAHQPYFRRQASDDLRNPATMEADFCTRMTGTAFPVREISFSPPSAVCRQPLSIGIDCNLSLDLAPPFSTSCHLFLGNKFLFDTRSPPTVGKPRDEHPPCEASVATPEQHPAVHSKSITSCHSHRKTEEVVPTSGSVREFRSRTFPNWPQSIKVLCERSEDF